MSAISKALRAQRQIDEDGCEVAVSRQACDQAAIALDGLPDGALDGGWTAAGLSEYAKGLEDQNATLRAALAERQAASIADVIAERQRQINVEGWTPEHDDAHFGAELSKAAGCYVHHANYGVGKYDYTEEGIPWKWPWAARWWKPKGRRRDLVRAAALILAEIDRMDRALATKEPQS